LTHDLKVDDETIQTIFQQDYLKKEYHKKTIVATISIIALGILLFAGSLYLIPEEMPVLHEFIKNVGLLTILVIVIACIVVCIAPSRLGIGNKIYTKSVVIEKEEFDKLKKLGLEDG